MLSYRHAFHAGNHADVLKHFLLSECLSYLTKKEPPFWYIDTHSGAGMYELETGYAVKTGEYRDGIGRIWAEANLPPGIARYKGMITDLNSEGSLHHYPGSPWIAGKFLRRGDLAFLHEIHPSDSLPLENLFKERQSFRVHKTDGFSALKGYLPPFPRRALVLIDPSYELETDYAKTVAAVTEAIRRFPGGMYMIWYPLLERKEAKELPERLMALGSGSRARIELTVTVPGPDGRGMYGSGIVIHNPPWILKDTIESDMGVLERLLGNGEAGRHLISWEER